MDIDTSLWDFSISVYASPDVAPSCLALQNDYGLDVNVVLFCVWSGLTRGPLRPANLDAALELSLTWAREVVRPLRAVRKWMKPAANLQSGMNGDKVQSLRNAIKRDELEAERLQQLALATIVSSLDPRRATDRGKQAADDNIGRYLDERGVAREPRVASLVAIVLDAADAIID